MFALAYLAFVLLFAWGGYWLGSWLGSGILTAIFGAILGWGVGRLLHEQVVGWWEGDTPASGRLKPRQRDQRRLITVEQAEADYFEKIGSLEDEVDPDRRAQLMKPLGYCNAEWEALKATIQDGDELWEFCNSRSMWKDFMGFHGISLIRQGKEVAGITLSVN